MIKNVKNFAIRLSLLFISIIGVYFCNNVSAVITHYGPYIRNFDTIGYNPIYGVQSYNINILHSGLPLTYALGSTKSFFLFDNNVYWWWGARKIPYFWLGNNCQGYITSYQVCTEIIDGNTDASCSSTVNISNYQSTSQLFGNFFRTITSGDYYSFGYTTADFGTNWYITFSSHEAGSSLRFTWSTGCPFTGSVGYQDISFDSFSNSMNYDPPSVGSSSDSGGGSSAGENTLIYTQGNNLNNTISYFENEFGWNKNLCYVGTNDLSSVYGTSGIDFEYGSGDSIFGLYYSLYNGFGDNVVQNVGRFINTWLINYSQWFATSPGNRTFLASYNGPGSNVTYYYTGLSFPYSGKSVAIYFMSDLLFNEYARESTQGEQMAYYCYLKLNYQSISEGIIDFEDVQDSVTPGIVGRINDSVNSYLSGRVGFLVPDLSGSVWGDVSSGNAFSGDVDPSNVFESFYDNILGIVNKGNYSGNGILPSWIIYPLLFLILFRILKH